MSDFADHVWGSPAAAGARRQTLSQNHLPLLLDRIDDCRMRALHLVVNWGLCVVQDLLLGCSPGRDETLNLLAASQSSAVLQ